MKAAHHEMIIFVQLLVGFRRTTFWVPCFRSDSQFNWNVGPVFVLWCFPLTRVWLHHVYVRSSYLFFRTVFSYFLGCENIFGDDIEIDPCLGWCRRCTVIGFWCTWCRRGSLVILFVNSIRRQRWHKQGTRGKLKCIQEMCPWGFVRRWWGQFRRYIWRRCFWWRCKPWRKPGIQL